MWIVSLNSLQIFLNQTRYLQYFPNYIFPGWFSHIGDMFGIQWDYCVQKMSFKFDQASFEHIPHGGDQMYWLLIL